MISYAEYREELENVINYHLDNMPENVKEAISEANTNLYQGPGYGTKTFKENCDIIEEYCNDINDLRIVFDYDETTGTEYAVTYEDSAKEIIRGILGKELYAYLYR